MGEICLVILGAVLSILLTAWYDWLKRPIIEVDELLKFQTFQDSPKRTHIQLNARNRASFHAWLPRNRASDVRGFITLKGSKTHIVRESVRWCNSKQPLMPRLIQRTPKGYIASDLHLYDESALRDEDLSNIFANDSERFDLFVHLHDVKETYFFSNKSYKIALGSWNVPDFRIWDNELSLKIELQVSGDPKYFKFRIKHALDPEKMVINRICYD